MIPPALFMAAHLAIVVVLLVTLAVIERRHRRTWTRWHRGVRTRHLTTEAVLLRLRKPDRRAAAADRRRSGH